MTSKLNRNNTVQLTDWQIFTNNGNFNNPMPPNRRLKKRNPYFVLNIDPNYVRDRSRTIRSRNQSAISTSTRRTLSARSVTYRRPLRVKPIDLDLDEECEQISVSPYTKFNTARLSTTSSERPQIWATQSWSFSYLHRAIIAIDEQAKKDYDVGRVMNALAAWQNALVFCDELSQRNQLWPENKAALDEELAALRRTYKEHLEEIMRNYKYIQGEKAFLIPTKKCLKCSIDQSLDEYHQRFSTVCQHVERTICNKCIYNKAKSSLETSKQTIETNCPETNCTATFNSKQICEQLNPTDTNTSSQNVNRQSRNQPSERKSEFIRCAYEECGSGQFHIINQKNPSPILTCVICKRQTCAVHRVKWHKGLTCTQYDQQQALPPLRIKQCLKCQTNIEENRQSSHIICSNCKSEYCFECMADYKKIQRNGPKNHKNTCSHYQSNSNQNSSKSSACTIL